MARRVIGWITRRTEPDLEAIADVETMRNVTDRSHLTDVLPPEWTVRSDIVLYGTDPLTDVLVFTHVRTRQELVLVPESNVDPTGPVEFFHHDRTAGYRRKLPVHKPTLSSGLRYVLDRIDRFET